MRLFPDRIETAPDSGGKWMLWKWLDIMKSSSGGAEHDDTYLTRLTFLRTPWFQIMLHFIYLPDQDRAVHDHPWSFWGVVLSGAYFETWGEPQGKRWMRYHHRQLVHRLIHKSSRTAHRITEIIGKRVITLLFTGPKVKSWGFYVRDVGRKMSYRSRPVVYVPWREYLS